MKKPFLLSLSMMGVWIGVVLGMLPTLAYAEQWLDAPNLQEKVKPLLDQSTQVYCQSQGLKN